MRADRFRRLRLEELESRQLLANLTILSVSTIPATPIAGEPFYVEVDFHHENATGESYTIGRSINGRPEQIAPPVSYGNGDLNHIWGTWILHHAGTYEITARLDAGNDIAETNENDNSMTVNVTVTGTVTEEWGLVQADEGLSLLGDGTDVIVGTMDDAFDFTHPWFTGNDSQGRPRLVASLQNSDGPDGSPLNAEHATAVMGIVLARGANAGDLTGLAPDARYVTAEFINRAQLPDHPVNDVVDAAGFLVDNNAEVINMSWSWWYGTTEQSESGETSTTNLLADYLAYGRNIVAVPAVNQLPDHDRPTAPGSSRNVITVGGLDASLQHAWDQQDYGPTLDGRSKPDLLGNAAEDVVATNANWRDGFLMGSGYYGTSFATPFVTGAAAEMLDYGKHNGQSIDHRVIKAVIMNSGLKTLDDDGSAWSNTSTMPLDNQQGTGVLNLQRVYEMYSAGLQPAGKVSSRGYDFSTIEGVAVDGDLNSAGRKVYQLGSPNDNGMLDVTLTWDRHTFWNDQNGDGRIDSPDTFYVSPADAQDNLDLILYRDGAPVAQSESPVDNVEHIHFTDLSPGNYELHVVRRDVANSGPGEDYALAWHSDANWASYSVSETDGATIVDESGSTDSLQVVLGERPISDVVLSVSSADTGEATVVPGSLIFTPENWDSPQTVVVTGVDDAILDGDQTTAITVAVAPSLSDDQFDALPAQVVDVVTHDNESPVLTVTINPKSISEYGGSATGEVSRSELGDGTALTVTLSSSDTSEATVQPSVMIPANRLSATFAINAVDDALLDGPQTVTILAGAGGFVSGADTLDVTDHETLTVTIDLASISESGGLATGTVRRSNIDLASPLIVNLFSSDATEATAPSSVTIPADRQSTSFLVSAIDDGVPDGTQTVSISAFQSGYASGSADIQIRDAAAPNPAWHNEASLADVDASGAVDIGDVLTLIGFIRQFGAHFTLPTPSSDMQPPPFVDVDANDTLEIHDLLVLIAVLRTQGSQSAADAEPASVAAVDAAFAGPLDFGPASTGGGSLLQPASVRRKASFQRTAEWNPSRELRFAEWAWALLDASSDTGQQRGGHSPWLMIPGVDT